MIHKVTMYAGTCDNCGETYVNEHSGFAAWGDENNVVEEMDNDGWYTEEGRDGKPDQHYCPLCHTINDDVLCLNASRLKPTKQ